MAHTQTAPSFRGDGTPKGTHMETLSQAQYFAALVTAATVGIGMLITQSRSQLALTRAMAARVAASIATLDDAAAQGRGD